MAAILFSEEIEGDELSVIVARCGACPRGDSRCALPAAAIATAAELRTAGWRHQQVIKMTPDEVFEANEDPTYADFVEPGWLDKHGVEKYHQKGFICPRCEREGRVLVNRSTNSPYRPSYFAGGGVLADSLAVT